MSKRQWIIASVLFAVLLVSIGGVMAKSEAAGPYMVTSANPITGKRSLLGVSVNNGIIMAVEDMNTAGGIKGQKIELKVEDLGETNTTAMTVTQKIISDKPLAIVGFPISPMAFACIPNIDEAGIPLLVTGTNSQLAATSKWVFNAITTDAVSATSATKFTVEDLKMDKIALLHTTDEYGQGAADIIKKVLTYYKKKPTIDIGFTSGEKDLTGQLLNIKNSGAEAILLYVQQTDILAVFKQRNQLGIKIPVVSCPVIPATIEQLDVADVEGNYASVTAEPNRDLDPKVREWAESFKKRLGRDADNYSATGYDAMMMLGEVMKVAGPDREKIRAGLQSLKGYKGICGVHFSDEDGNLTHQAIIVQVRNKLGMPIKAVDVSEIKLK